MGSIKNSSYQHENTNNSMKLKLKLYKISKLKE